MDWTVGVDRQDEVEVVMASGDKRWYIVSDDVRNPWRLRRTVKHLAGYGLRLQYSLPVPTREAVNGAHALGAFPVTCS